ARLAKAWLDSTRDSRLAGNRAGRQRGAAVLSESLVARTAPRLRREVLGLLAEAAPGTPVDDDTAMDILAWRRPRRRVDDAARAILAQASFLGVTARDAITGYGRLLIAEPADDPLGIHAPDTEPLIAALDDLLPPPVDELVVQSDLTVIVPGQPSTLLAAELSVVADKESVTVHRVTEASLRRAMDAGYTAEDLRAVFAKRARGDLPQTLTYLIDDVARRHGGLRAGRAEAYLRSQDETLLAQVLADPRLTAARLRRLAPTVLISPLPLEDLLEALRARGHSPVAEDSSGAVVIARAVDPRAPVVVRPERTTDPTPRVDGAPLAALVETVRAAPIPATIGGAGAQAAAETLRDAVPDRALVWVEYVDGRGDQVRRLLRPVSLGSGFLRAEDKRTDMLHTIALSTIRSVTPVSVRSGGTES
ncbi:MAG TPA: helicase-associated domain-containing protein, partial [Stackebrandtia sp.]|uniref:helicase-associated domain-containing protein n=1 Tax=Stackebrandtia sp. TaxID=2023065 RepID=UPI002D46EDC0